MQSAAKLTKPAVGSVAGLAGRNAALVISAIRVLASRDEPHGPGMVAMRALSIGAFRVANAISTNAASGAATRAIAEGIMIITL